MRKSRLRINTFFGYFDSEGATCKQFCDYQGNVRSVVTGWAGQEIQSTDYYPYGMPVSTSTGAAANRYKYSSKELETRDGMNMYNFDARMYFADLGLMNRPDPQAAQYPMYNPYLYCAANPMMFIDPTGETIFAYDGDKRIWFGYRNGDLVVTDDDGNKIDRNDLTIANKNLYDALELLLYSVTGSGIVKSLIRDPKALLITVDGGSYNWFNHVYSRVNWIAGGAEGGLAYDFVNRKFVTFRDPAIGLFHELVHAYDFFNGTFDKTIKNNVFFESRSCELFACYMENQLRREWNYPIRIGYDTNHFLPIWCISDCGFVPYPHNNLFNKNIK